MNIKELQKEKLMLRKKDPLRAGVYASVLDTANKIAKVENREMTENDIIKAAKKNIKNLSSTVELVKMGDVVNQYKEEIVIMTKEFLPTMVDDETLKNKIKEVTKDMEKTMKNMGKVIGLIKKEFGDSVDMSKVSKFVKEELKQE